MEATPRPWRVRNNSGRHHEYFIESDSSRWSIADNIVEKDAALIVKAVNSHQALVDALTNSHKWLMKICQSHIGGDATKMSFNWQELSDNLKALKAAGEEV